MNKIGHKLMLIMSFVLAFGFNTAGAKGNKTETEGDFKYQVVDSESVSVTGYIGNQTDIVIPDYIKGHKVVDIHYLLNNNNDKVHKIVLNSFIECDEVADQLGKLRDCMNLESIDVADTNPSLCAKDGVLYNKDMSILYVYPRAKKDVSFVMPSTVEKSYNFIRCKYLKNITLSSNKKYKDSGVFTGSSLEKVVIPKNVTRIEEDAFYQCKKLKTVQFGGKEQHIDDRAFCQCNKLKSIKLPSTVKTVGLDAFSECKQLKSIKLNKGLRYIGHYAFAKDPKLKKITLPSTVKKTGYNIFWKTKIKLKKSNSLKKVYKDNGYGKHSYKYIQK